MRRKEITHYPVARYFPIWWAKCDCCAFQFRFELGFKLYKILLCKTCGKTKKDVIHYYLTRHSFRRPKKRAPIHQ